MEYTQPKTFQELINLDIKKQDEIREELTKSLDIERFTQAQRTWTKQFRHELMLLLGGPISETTIPKKYRQDADKNKDL